MSTTAGGVAASGSIARHHALPPRTGANPQAPIAHRSGTHCFSSHHFSSAFIPAWCAFLYESAAYHSMLAPPPPVRGAVAFLYNSPSSFPTSTRPTSSLPPRVPQPLFPAGWGWDGPQVGLLAWVPRRELPSHPLSPLLILFLPSYHRRGVAHIRTSIRGEARSMQPFPLHVRHIARIQW